jgi:hypothetical protein
MRPEDPDGLAALNEEGLVFAKRQKRADKGAEGVVIPSRLARAAVDDEVLGPLGHVPVEVVQEHAKRRLRLPGAGVQSRTPRRADRAEVSAQLLDGRVERTDAHSGVSQARMSRPVISDGHTGKARAA